MGPGLQDGKLFTPVVTGPQSFRDEAAGGSEGAGLRYYVIRGSSAPCYPCVGSSLAPQLRALGKNSFGDLGTRLIRSGMDEVVQRMLAGALDQPRG